MGRPALWGLAFSGQQGVEDILQILKKELHSTMGLAGININVTFFIIGNTSNL